MLHKANPESPVGKNAEFLTAQTKVKIDNPEESLQKRDEIISHALKSASYIPTVGKNIVNQLAEVAYIASNLSMDGNAALSALKKRRGVHMLRSPKATVMDYHGRNNDRFFGIGEKNELKGLLQLIFSGELAKVPSIRLAAPQGTAQLVVSGSTFASSELESLLGSEWQLNYPIDVNHRMVLTADRYQPTQRELPPHYFFTDLPLNIRDLPAVGELLKSYPRNFFKEETLNWGMHRGIVYRKISGNRDVRLVSIGGVYDIVPVGKEGTLVIASDVVTDAAKDNDGNYLHRGKGLAEITFSRVLGNIIKEIPQPIIAIDSNRTAMKMSSSVGFSLVDTNYWCSYRRKSSG